MVIHLTEKGLTAPQPSPRSLRDQTVLGKCRLGTMMGNLFNTSWKIVKVCSKTSEIYIVRLFMGFLDSLIITRFKEDVFEKKFIQMLLI